MRIPVVHYESDHVPNPNPNGETPFEDFWSVRSSVLEAFQIHGETGPDARSDNPRYWLVDDQYNDELYQNAQVYSPSGWTAEWLLAVVAALRKHPGWALSVSYIDQGHLIAFSDRLMVSGPTFANCNDVYSVVNAARIATEQFEERKLGPLSRQLKYIQRLLPAAMQEALANSYAYLATFNGYELHEGHAIWMLQSKNDSELSVETEYAPLRSSAVTADGTIHPEFCKEFWPYTDVSPPYWLFVYLVEDKTRTKLKLVGGNGNRAGAITIDKVLTDEGVKREDSGP
jgi:hypothetical protein